MSRKASSTEITAYLHAHGLTLSPSALSEMVREAVDQLPFALRAADGRSELPEAEMALLRKSGLEFGPLAPGSEDPLAKTVARHAALLQDSMTTSETAELLGVDASRVRQRLLGRPPSLYGLRLGSTWRIPKFQFDEGTLLPGMELVVARLPADLHPVAMLNWFLAPSTELTDERFSDEPISPRDWLRLGLAPQVVAELAADL